MVNMHHIVVGLFLYLSTGLARPTPNDPPGSNSRSSPPGLPTNELPPLNLSDFSVGRLLLPIGPDATLTQTITYASSPAGPFDGGHLISSIIGRTYTLWKDTANAPIQRPEEDRSTPYMEVLHAIQPSLLARTELTPLKAGIVYCWIVRQVLLEASWPGQIIARVSHADRGRVGRELGTIRVINSPLHGATESTPQAPALSLSSLSITNTSEFTSSGPNAIPKSTREKAWLQVFSEMMLFIFARPPYQFVEDFIRRAHPSRTATLRFPSVIDDQLEGRMVFYGGKPDLVWDHIAIYTQPLAHLVVSRDEWDYRETVNMGPPGSPYVSILFAASAEPGAVLGADGIEVVTTS
ncbi:MAG: hypothetical protein Q9202_003883 [Teloschistes flavicans]